MKLNLLTAGLCGAALLAYAVIMFSIPSRANTLRKQAGQQYMPLTNTASVKWILIAVLSAVLICILPFRDMDLFVNVILLFVALIAAELAAREAANRGLAGVYKDAIVCGSQTIYFTNIEALPTLAYENDPESTGNYKTSLSIILRNGNETTLVFANEQERTQAVRTILELVPRLRP